MHQALIVEFHIKLDCIDDFALAIQKNAAASLANEPGCHRFDVCRDPADPTLFFLYELYDSPESIQAHKESKHFSAFNDQTQSWVASKTVRHMLRADTAG